MRTFTLAALLALCAAPLAAADWSSFHNDDHNSGFVKSSDYEVYTDVWWTAKLSPATQSDTTPVLDSQSSIAVVTSWDHKVRAYDQESGAELWNQTLSAKISGTPVIDNGRLFVVDTSGTLNAYNVQKGTLLGTVNVGATLGSPTVHEGKIFIGNEAGELKSYDTDTLTLLWTFTDALPMTAVKTTGTGSSATQSCDTGPGPAIPAGQIRGAPAVAYGKVYFASLNHYVYAVDEFGNPQKTTDPEWVFATHANVFASPLVTHHRVYIGSYDESFYALEAEPSGEGPVKATSGSTTTLCGALQVSDPVWNYCVPPASSGGGDSKVQSTAAADADESTTDADFDSTGHIIFGSNNGDVTALDPDEGGGTTGTVDCTDPDHTEQTPLWTFHTKGAVKSSPAVANGFVVVGSDDGHVYWLSAADGSLKRDFKPTGTAPIKSNPAIDGKRAFVTSFEGDIYMFGPKVPARPDLMAVPSYVAGVVHVAVSNVGDGAAGTSTVRIQADGALLADVAVQALAPNAQVNLTVNGTLAPGPHTLKAIADNNNEVKESKESNNIATVSVTVAPPPPPPPPVPTGSGKPGAASSSGKKKLAGPEIIPVLAGLAAALLAARRRT